MNSKYHLPSGWKEIQLGDERYGVFSKGAGITKDEVRSEGLPCIRYGEIYTTHHFVIQEFKSFIDRDSASNSKQIRKNDILFAGSGETKEEIGKSVAYINDFEAYAGGDVIIYTPNQSAINSLYLAYNLNVGVTRSELNKLGQGDSVVHIYPSHLSKLKVILPAPTEQSAVANLLATFDEGINLFKNKIDLLRKRKKSLMKSLLSGDARLKGFIGEWHDLELQEIAEHKGLVRGPFGGSLKKEDFVPDGYKVYEQKNAIYRSLDLGRYFINEEKFLKLKRFSVESGDFIVSCSGTIGRIYQIPHHYHEGVINQALLKIRVNKELVNDKYFFYQFEWDNFQEKIIDNTQGGAMQNLVGMDLFKKTKIPFPPTIDEQIAIAEILTNADEEIALNEAKLCSYESQKKYLLNNLLIGNLRLPEFRKGE